MKFYVRNFNIEFPVRDTNGVQSSSDGLLHYYQDVLWVHYDMLGYSGEYSYFGFVSLHDRTPESSMAQLTVNGVFNPFNSKIRLNYQTFNGQNRTQITEHQSTNWVTHGWSSDPSTLRTELCTYLRNLRNQSAYHVIYPTSYIMEDNVNLLFFNITFTDRPGENYFLHCFYEGNTEQADEVITI